VHAQATDLIISEYDVGAPSIYDNKYMEIYNGTPDTIDLSDYQFQAHFGQGETTLPYPYTETLSGLLLPNAAKIYCHPGAMIYMGTALNPALMNLSASSTMVLWKISTSSIVDIFGSFGCDPATDWTTPSGGSIVNHALVRKPSVCHGVTEPPAPCTFPGLASEWYVLPMTLDSLGSHTMTCGSTVNFDTSSSASLENTTTVVSMSISPAATALDTILVTVSNGQDCYNGLDYTLTPLPIGVVVHVPVAVGDTSASLSIYTANDSYTEGPETVTFTITGTTSGTALGADLVHVFTILDDDSASTLQFTNDDTTVVSESAGTVTYTVSFIPPVHPAGTFNVQLFNFGTTYGAGAGGDYTTVPDGSSGTVVVPFGVDDTTASFNVLITDDATPEDDESFDMALTGVSVIGMFVNEVQFRTLTIVDDDDLSTEVGGPALLQGGAKLTVLYDGGKPYLRHSFPVGSLLEVRDGTGRMVAQTVVHDNGLLALPVDGLAHGLYVLRLSDGMRTASSRFVH